jgi:cytochrome c553
VSWEGPEFKKREIQPDVLFSVGGRAMVPLDSEEFRPEPQKAQRGARMFTMLGCASCHATPGLPPARQYKPLVELNPEAQGGCLGEQPAKAVPKYDFSADQRSALAAAVTSAAKGKLETPLDAKEVVTRTAAAMNCYACHRRDGVGGPDVQREEFFVMKGEFDMGDEGRFAPNLSRVGFKLRQEAIDGILYEGKHHVRPVLATRMPRFARDATNAGAALAYGGGGGPRPTFVQALEASDEPFPEVKGYKPPRGKPHDGPDFSELAAKDGRKLVGTKGLGCVNCHGVAGNKSLGMPAPDLSTSYERLKYQYFSALLHDPLKANPGTRMPAYWTDGAVVYKDLGGGTPQGQINAMWAYVSLGRSMPLPAGIEPLAGTELIPADEPIVHRTFMADVGPRAILVGYPDSLNVAFDANAVRLAKAWRGRFFDAKGMWEGRGGSALGPLGIDVINLPPGPSFAVLSDAASEWPVAKAKQRNVGGEFKGYVLDKEMRPAFRYVLDGVEVRESPIPLLKPGGASLVRRFQLTSKADVAGLYFLAASGKKIESKSAGEWTVDNKLTVRVTAGGSADAIEPAVRDGNGGKELVVPVKFNNGDAAFDVEMSW